MKNITQNTKIIAIAFAFFLLGSFIFFLVTNKLYIIIIFPLLSSVYFIYLLLKIFHKTTQDVYFMVDAMQNSDFGISFKLPPQNDKFLHKIYTNFNAFILKSKNSRIQSEANALFYKQIMDKIPFPQVVFEQQGNIVYANNFFMQLAVNNNIKNLDNLPIEKSKIDIILHQSSLQRSILDWDSKRTFLLQSSDFVADGKLLKMVSFMNFSLEMQQKELQSWTDLLKVLTHEIMNSITPITSLANTALHYIPDNNPDLLLAISTIEKRAKGLNVFIYSFRNLTKELNPNIQATKISDLFDELDIYIKNYEIYKLIDFEFQIDTISPTIFIDKSLIMSVLINLIINATDALEQIQTPKIIIKAQRLPYSKVEISVSDNGKGISTEALPKIFIPFFSTKKHGSGIGLSIAKQIVQAHRAELKVISIENNGSSFSIIF